MPVRVEIKLDAKSMTDFMIYHIYSTGVGIVALVLGALNIGLTLALFSRGNYLMMLLFLAFALIILVGFPYVIKRKVAAQMEHSKRVNAPVTYIFDETGVETITEEASGKASWGKFVKAVSAKNLVILYDPAKRAIILPMEQIQEEYTAIVDLIFANMPAPAVRIRRVDK